MRSLLNLLLVAILAVSMACCSTLYSIKMKDGQEFISKGEPEFDKKSGTYEFESIDGKKVRVTREEVEVIKEKGKP